VTIGGYFFRSSEPGAPLASKVSEYEFQYLDMERLEPGTETVAGLQQFKNKLSLYPVSVIM